MLIMSTAVTAPSTTSGVVGGNIHINHSLEPTPAAAAAAATTTVTNSTKSSSNSNVKAAVSSSSTITNTTATVTAASTTPAGLAQAFFLPSHAITGLYELDQTIGQGHFAVVKSARHVFSGERVAIKIIDKQKLDPISRDHLFQEVRCMKLVQHPNVVRLYEVIDSPSKLYLIQELGVGGDMYDYIMKHPGGLGEERARRYFGQIVRAVKYCHDLRVVHRDLKPENVVFFPQTGQVKLTDFGFSNVFSPEVKLLTSCGSLAYSAPEILLGDSYLAPPVDVWSLGVILYMLVTGRAPFNEANDSETLTMILDCKFVVPAHVSASCRDLITRMIVRQPDKRMRLVDVCSHEWLNTKHVATSASNNRLDDDYDEEEEDEDFLDDDHIVPKHTTAIATHYQNSHHYESIASNESSDDNRSHRTSSSSSSINRRRRGSKRSSSGDSLTNKNRPSSSLSQQQQQQASPSVPLVKRENLSEKDNKDILKLMVNGNIAASEDQIVKALDEDKYDYITATYYLLAERLLKNEYLKRKRLKFKNNTKRLKKLNNNAAAKTISKPINEVNNSENSSSQDPVITKRESPNFSENTANSNVETSSLSMPSSTLSKANFSNLMKMQRDRLRHQKDSSRVVMEEEDVAGVVVVDRNDMLEEEDEDEEIDEDDDEDDDDDDGDDEEETTLAAAKVVVEEVATADDEDLIATAANNKQNLQQLLLTNIIEDDEESSSPNRSNRLATAAAAAALLQQQPSNSRRSSRGTVLTGTDNMISSLTIPEEVDEVDATSNTSPPIRHNVEITHIKVNELVYPNALTDEYDDDKQERIKLSRSLDDVVDGGVGSKTRTTTTNGGVTSRRGIAATAKINEVFYEETSGVAAVRKASTNSSSTYGGGRSLADESSDRTASDSDQDLIIMRSTLPTAVASASGGVALRHELPPLTAPPNYDWGRSASSRSRNKIRSSDYSRGNGNGYYQASASMTNGDTMLPWHLHRPLSLSNDSNSRVGGGDVAAATIAVDIADGPGGGGTSNTGDSSSNAAMMMMRTSHPNITRARSLAESTTGGGGGSIKVNAGTNGSTGTTGVNTTSGGVGASLSVEHRQANMSQMSISSQLSSKTGGASLLRQHHNNPSQHHHAMLVHQMMHAANPGSAVPTPRESLVFFRGDEKPIAKLLLQQQQQQHQQQQQQNQQHSQQPNENSSKLSQKEQQILLENVVEVTSEAVNSAAITSNSTNVQQSSTNTTNTQASTKTNGNVITPTSLSESVIKHKLDTMVRCNNESYSNAINIGDTSETSRTGKNSESSNRSSNITEPSKDQKHNSPTIQTTTSSTTSTSGANAMDTKTKPPTTIINNDEKKQQKQQTKATKKIKTAVAAMLDNGDYDIVYDADDDVAAAAAVTDTSDVLVNDNNNSKKQQPPPSHVSSPLSTTPSNNKVVPTQSRLAATSSPPSSSSSSSQSRAQQVAKSSPPRHSESPKDAVAAAAATSNDQTTGNDKKKSKTNQPKSATANPFKSKRVSSSRNEAEPSIQNFSCMKCCTIL